ncbi:MAG: hypothetical protein QOE14_2688 [Humisphaera sp.]|nr:hypothetical protein [Humisphaera sp.]
MQPNVRAPLFDAQHAVLGIEMFVAGKTRDDFENDLMLRLAVERQFEIIGEALGRLRNVEPALLDKISEHQGIVSFRNALIHGYDKIDNNITWRIIQEKLPVLHKELHDLLKQP